MLRQCKDVNKFEVFASLAGGFSQSIFGESNVVVVCYLLVKASHLRANLGSAQIYK